MDSSTHTFSDKLKGMKVLICDDAGFIRQILLDILSETEATLFESQNGKQALEMASSVRPDLVFLDIVLPYKNGVEVAKILKAQDPKIKIVAMSTLELEQIQKIYKIEGLFDRVMTKPFKKSEILDAMEVS
jgi:two-component system chemotaxis response regulator CheY